MSNLKQNTVCELPEEFPNNLRLAKLGNIGKTSKMWRQSSMPSLRNRNKTGTIGQKFSKMRYHSFLVMPNFS